MALSTRRKLLFAALVCVFALVAAEVLLRLVTYQVGLASIPEDQVRRHLEKDAMVFHDELGWVRDDLPNPGLGINAHGFRHPDVSQRKPAGTWRAFALGDSQTYGAGVDAPEAYPSQAEALLRERAPEGATVELINAGISGYTSLQALRLVQVKLLDWDPDAIIVDCRTHDSPRDDMVAGGATTGLLDRLTFHSRLAWTLRFAIERIRPQHARPMQAGAMEMSAQDLAATFGNHSLIVELARSEGFDLLFVDYPFWDGQQVTCLAPANELPAGVPVAPACAALRDAGVPLDQLFLDNNHLTVEGNRRVAQALAETIVGQGWLGE